MTKTTTAHSTHAPTASEPATPQDYPPIIGIVPTYVPEEDLLRLKQNYCLAIEQWGGMPLMLPMTEDTRIYEYLLPQIDGFLFTGGHDICPERYGETRRSDKLSPLTPNRDRMENRILNYAYDFDIPVLGICRGMQMMNVHFGGTLYQDLADEYHSVGGNKWALEGIYIPDDSGDVAESAPFTVADVERVMCPGCVYEGKNHPDCPQDRIDMARTTVEYKIMQSSEATRLKHWQQDHYECPSHFVNIDPATILGGILKTEHLAVNSMHHQGVKDVAPGFRAAAFATDGLVEAIEMPDRSFFIGTQWHPEFFRVRMGLVFDAFIKASAQRYNERLAAGQIARSQPRERLVIRE